MCFKLFDRLRIEKPEFMTKIKIIDGNLEEQSLKISTDNRDWLINNVNFVFHCAATIRFNESIQIATKINIQGTENVVTLATNMINLKVIENINRSLIIIIIKKLNYR